MNENQLNNLAEDVRKESYTPSTSGTDLVYDPGSGEFRTVPRGYSPSNGETVTKFTEGGFAADAGQIVAYLREDELKRAEENLDSSEEVPTYVEEIDPDEVFHIHFHPDDGKRHGNCQFPGFCTKNRDDINGRNHQDLSLIHI